MKTGYYLAIIFAVHVLAANVAWVGGLDTNLAERLPFRIFDVHMHANHAEMWLSLFPKVPEFGHQSTNDVELREDTIRAMDKSNIAVALLFGDNDLVEEWALRYPTRFIPAFTPEVGYSDFADRDHEAEAKKLAELIRLGKAVLQGIPCSALSPC